MTSSRHTELFIRTLDDLERRIAEQDPYEILGGSALVRKLFLDDHPLVDQVNCQFRRKIVFEVGKVPELPAHLKPDFYSIQDGLDPDSSHSPHARATLTRDQFLKMIVMTIGSRDYSLREVILFEANVMGGVHAGTPKEDKEKVLDALGSSMSVGGYRSSLRQLQAVGRVILKALGELRVDALGAQP
jgi:hypothetical protein